MKKKGIHRGLGIHISKVKSATLDLWTPKEIEKMNGNQKCNECYEANIGNEKKPNEKDSKFVPKKTQIIFFLVRKRKVGLLINMSIRNTFKFQIIIQRKQLKKKHHQKDIHNH